MQAETYTSFGLASSQEWCHRFSRQHAKHFSLAFSLMPRPQRQAMEAVYAFCQVADQAVDEGPVKERAANLDRVRATLDRIIESANPDPAAPWSAALVNAIESFHLDATPFYDLLRGMQMDLNQRRYRDWSELDDYCWHVAGVVGLMVIEILGCQGKLARKYARELGLALQMINILRDVREDALEGRVYLPQQLLDMHGLTRANLATDHATAAHRAALRELANRAEDHYRRADQLLGPEDRRRLRLARLIGEVYYPLLAEIKRRDYDVFSSRPSLSSLQKLFFMIRGFWRCRR